MENQIVGVSIPVPVVDVPVKKKRGPEPHTLLVEKLELEMKQLRARIANVKARRAEVNKAYRAAAKSGRVTSFYASGSGEVSIRVRMDGLDGFKKGPIVRALTRVEKVTGGEFKNTYDYPENGERDYVLNKDGISVAIDGYLKDSAKNCRKVQTGTRIVETPVYELVCD